MNRPIYNCQACGDPIVPYARQMIAGFTGTPNEVEVMSRHCEECAVELLYDRIATPRVELTSLDSRHGSPDQDPMLDNVVRQLEEPLEPLDAFELEED